MTRRGETPKVTVWSLRMKIPWTVAASAMDSVREKVRQMCAAQPEPFIWCTYGTRLEIRTQGPLAPLLEFIEWAADGGDVTPKEISIERVSTFPLVRTGDWQGNGR